MGEFLELEHLRASLEIFSELSAYISSTLSLQQRHVSFQAKEKYQEGSGGVTERIRVLSEVKHMLF